MNVEMPVVVLSGSPYERGLAHGTHFKREIASILDRDFGLLTERRLSQARTRASESFDRIRSTAPHVADEINGIADGVGRDIGDLVLRSGFELFKPAADTGCSAVSVKTPTGAIAAQNWDGVPAKQGDLALFLHFSPDGFQFAVIDSLGSLGAVGMNRHGLALVNTDLLLVGTRAGIPSRVIRRLILDCKDVPSAKRKIADLPHMAGRTYLLADRSENVAAVEVSARGGANFFPSADIHLHTNNALLPVVAEEEDHEGLSQVYPSSAARLSALQAAANGVELDVESVKRILADEAGAPNSVCKTASDSEPTQTAFSVVMDCARGEMHLAAGRPSMNPYRKFRLPLH